MQPDVHHGLLVVVVCLLAGVSTTMAQEVGGGVVVGGDAATLTFKGTGPSVDFTSRAGLVAGAFVIAQVSPAFAIEPELLFEMRGASLAAGSVASTFRVNVIDVPVLARFSSRREGRTGMHAVVGPSFGFRVSARRTTTSAAGETTTTDVGDQSRRADVGLVAGAGVDAGRLFIDARFTWALTRANTDTSDDARIHSRVFALLAGIRFGRQP